MLNMSVMFSFLYCFVLGCLAGLDMVEVNPKLGSADDSQKTAKNALTLIEVFLGKEHPATLKVPVVEASSTTNS